ncbi:MAG: transposase [Moraxellaceae bacterium]|nr:transposase [Pseudobdellovibrionaceae bacterium]
MKRNKQESFLKYEWDHRYKHGGELRKKRAGRFSRPLSTKHPHHLVFKLHKQKLRHRTLRSASGFLLTQKIIQHYAKMFFIKIEQVSIQNDHIHLLIRTSRRSFFQNFFRVVAGQISQQFQKEGLLKLAVTGTPSSTAKNGFEVPKVDLWMHRPFTHLAKSIRAYHNVKNYIQLNEKEVTGVISYRKKRLKGMSIEEIKALWM